jgi:hypothetical protein
LPMQRTRRAGWLNKEAARRRQEAKRKVIMGAQDTKRTDSLTVAAGVEFSLHSTLMVGFEPTLLDHAPCVQIPSDLNICLTLAKRFVVECLSQGRTC